MNDSLGLHHELLLLALHDRKGTHAYGQMVQIGLGGALLTELLLGERVRIVQEGNRWRKSFVEVVDASPTHDSAMDATLARLKGARRRANPSNTVTRIGNLKGLRALVLRDLCRRGILRETEQEILILFRRKVYPTVDPGPERRLVERVRQALEGNVPVDARTASLISLAHLTGTLAAIYDRKERKALKSRIEGVRDTSPAGSAAREAVEAAQAAVTAAVTAAMVASTAAAS